MLEELPYVGGQSLDIAQLEALSTQHEVQTSGATEVSAYQHQGAPTWSEGHPAAGGRGGSKVVTVLTPWPLVRNFQFTAPASYVARLQKLK